MKNRELRTKLYTNLTKVPSPVKQPEAETSIDVNDSDSDISVVEQGETNQQVEDTGPKIQIKLRSGNEVPKAVMMPSSRKFSALKTTWCSAQGYKEVFFYYFTCSCCLLTFFLFFKQCDVSFYFDGDLLSLSATPEDEDLEGGEIIDIKIKPGAMKGAVAPPKASAPVSTSSSSSSSSASSSSSTSSSSPSSTSVPNMQQASGVVAMIVSVINGGKKNRLKINKNAPLQVLFDGYVKAMTKTLKLTKKVIKECYFECNSVRLDLKKSATELGISETSKVLFKKSV